VSGQCQATGTGDRTAQVENLSRAVPREPQLGSVRPLVTIPSLLISFTRSACYPQGTACAAYQDPSYWRWPFGGPQYPQSTPHRFQTSVVLFSHPHGSDVSNRIVILFRLRPTRHRSACPCYRYVFLGRLESDLTQVLYRAMPND